MTPTGFVFYSHIASQKGRELAANPKAALLFHWKSLRRQVRIRGPVSPVTDAEADAYFATRPKQAQIGAWASQQSQPLESRFAFEQAIAKVAAKHIIGEVPRPPGWSGWRIAPLRSSNSGTTARSACTTASNSAATLRINPGPRRGFIPDREFEGAYAHFIQQRTAAHAASDRRQPRHRPCDRDPLFLGRLARHHLFAPSLPGRMSVGRGA